MYGSTMGAGANSAITPDTTGPMPKPADRASVARRAPASGGDSSCTQTLPGLMIEPIASPKSSRPASSRPKPWLPRQSSALAPIASTLAGNTSARRPRLSDARPARISPGTSPSAYAPNRIPSAAADSPRSRR